MINDLDELLQQLLERELPSSVKVVFEQPTREWSSRRGHELTLNFFLYDIRENVKLRNISPAWRTGPSDKAGRAKMEPPWKRIDLYYMLTAWANEANDEHFLLSSCLNILFRHPKIYIPGTRHADERQNDLPPIEFPEGLKNQPSPIMIQIAQPETLTKPTDIWSVLDNDMRPAISCVVTLAIDPYIPVERTLVRVLDVRVGQSEKPSEQELEPETLQNSCSVGGLLQTKNSLEGVRLTLVERGLDAALQSDGTWGVDKLLHAGTYTLELTHEGNKKRSYKLEVPSETYNIEW
jgi:hypothetical protein